MPAVLNSGLIAWAKASWYLEDCEATEAATGVPKYWRFGPIPNLNQLHHAYKKHALKHARSKFDELAKTKCAPLYEGCTEEGAKSHKLPASPADVEDDGQFRLVILGADSAGVIGDPPNTKTVEFLRTYSSPSVTRKYQNIVLVATPSVTGLSQAEQQIAEWMAWENIEGSKQFKDLEDHQQTAVRKRKQEAFKEAQTAVKNAYELVAFLDKDGSIQAKKITMGAQSLFATLLQEPALRLFNKKIDAAAIMPGGLYPVWPADDASVAVSGLYQEFGKRPQLPKLLSPKAVLNTIEDAVRRGLLAVRCRRSDGSEQWYWRSEIDFVDWEKTAEAFLPAKATLNSLNAAAVLPTALTGLWPEDDTGVKLSTVFTWFGGNHCYEEETQAGYPPEFRPIPKVDFSLVHRAVAKAVEESRLWLVFGNDSVHGEPPTTLQLDPDAMLYRPPASLAAIDLLPNTLPAAWTNEAEPRITVTDLYAAVKEARGKPWPPKLFIDGLNAALGQGFIHRSSGSGPVSSLQTDANVELVIRTEKIQAPPPPAAAAGGRRASTMAVLNIGELQDLADHVHTLMKPLAGCDPQLEVRLTIKAKGEVDLEQANQVLQDIKAGWKF